MYEFFFQQGIKPMWEDSRNKQGGRWLINVNKSQRMTDLNNYWLEIVSIYIIFFFQCEIKIIFNNSVLH